MNNKFKFSKSVLGLAVITGLSGCAATKKAEGEIKEALSDSKVVFDGMQPRTSVSVLDGSRDVNANFGKVTKNWVNPNPLPRDFINKKSETLPRFFKEKVAFSMPGSVTLVEIISEIKRAKGVNVFISQDIYSVESKLGSVIQAGGNASAESSEAPVPLRVSDFVVQGLTLQEALDFLAAKANISWKWTGEEIEFFRYETKTYTINLLPGRTTSSASVNLSSESEDTVGATASNNNDSEVSANDGTGGGQAGTVSASLTQGVTRESSFDSWLDVQKFILPLLSSRGKMSIMESTGIVTITDTPDVQRKVSQAIKSLNNIISKQIMLRVDVYSVLVDEADDYGLDLNLAFKGSERWGLSFNNSSGSGGTSVGTIDFTGSNRWNAGAVVKALSTLGKASIVNQYNVATLNGQPTPIGNNNKVPYISGIDIQTDQNGNPMQSINTSSVFKGISMNITPKLLPNGKILIEYAMNISDVLGFKTLTTGGSESSQALSLPETSLNNILQRASVRSGQAMVLSGFKQRVNSSNKNGTGSPNVPLLGGGVKSQAKEQYMVVVVTPTVSQDNDE